MGDKQYEKVDQGDKDDPFYGDMELQKYNPNARYTKKIAVGQVTIRLPIYWHPLNLIALAYGFLPWIIPISLFVHWVITRHFITLYTLVASLVVMVLNEGILKPVLKQPRPPETANRYPDGSVKHGMPSGHVLNATTIMVYLLCEVAVRGAGYEPMDQDHGILTIEWLVAILLLMGPVPWARWYNLDHTLNQCLVSLVLGTIAGVGFFFIRIHFFPDHWRPWIVEAAHDHSKSSKPVHV
eukprot:gnl/TRDRNA2_/TRDRNA2_195835_c0_seq1.p1 gnl/TRDRNA2_/TRDRNA2_195835_c0~~gnl/TRDRNA2_/TRDRNA2_195835_c0_seq1.p1  ORF type:complete len:261 (+),score=35.86 gnl/TRDRNA2_/TRDRNA2_195835_c0_seq1:67-783(+)